MMLSRMGSTDNVLSRIGLRCTEQSRRGRCARCSLLLQLFAEAFAVIPSRRPLHAALLCLIAAHGATRSGKVGDTEMKEGIENS